MKKKYTMEEFKKMFVEAKMKVLADPTDGDKSEVAQKAALSLALSGVLLFGRLEKELFNEEEN